MNRTVVKEIDLPTLRASDSARTAPLGQRLDLVEDVPVQLTVTLGSAELPVGKLFALTNGEVLALDRDVDAPVDIRLGSKLVARGLLVAAGDRFGVRITELPRE
jgi:flagellar motor switch protein FliN